MSTVDHTIRCITLGDTATGKTSLLTRIAFDRFEESYDATIGIDYLAHIVRRHGRSIKLQLWDTAGAERFRSIISSYFRNSHICFLVYSLTHRCSFLRVLTWYRLALDSNFKGRFILVGTKYSRDMREVSYQEGQELALKLDVPFVETSAADGYNVHTLVHLTIQECCGNMFDVKPTADDHYVLHPRSGRECCLLC